MERRRIVRHVGERDRLVLCIPKEDKDRFSEHLEQENKMRLLPMETMSHVSLRFLKKHTELRAAAHRSGKAAIVAIEELCDFYRMLDEMADGRTASEFLEELRVNLRRKAEKTRS